jgi:hypothetical protein
MELTRPDGIDLGLDPELRAPVLDLSRPELAPLMDRYRTPMPSETYRSLALIVGRDEEGTEPLARALESEGWLVGTCRGPELSRCPLINGGSCVLREDADMTVMFADPTLLKPGMGPLPRLLCAAHGSMPSVIALEGRVDRVRADEMHAIVGAMWGPEAILEAVERVRVR